jgi:tRNA U38,U39,U40 pseudouridine synthase TruA
LAKVEKKFNPKNRCDSRKYEYLIPTYSFQEKKKDFKLSESSEKFYSEKKSLKIEDFKNEDLIGIVDSNYRITKEKLEKVNLLFGKLAGTHCFRNYTNWKDSTNLKSTFRYIIYFKTWKHFLLLKK